MLTLGKRLVRDLLETSDLRPCSMTRNFVTLYLTFTSVLSTLGLALIWIVFTYGLYQPNSTWGGNIIIGSKTNTPPHHNVTNIWLHLKQPRKLISSIEPVRRHTKRNNVTHPFPHKHRNRNMWELICQRRLTIMKNYKKYLKLLLIIFYFLHRFQTVNILI